MFNECNFCLGKEQTLGVDGDDCCKTAWLYVCHQMVMVRMERPAIVYFLTQREGTSSMSWSPEHREAAGAE